MFNRKKLYRERLEIYLVYLLYAYRLLFVLAGVVGMLYSIFVMANAFIIGSILLLLSVLPLLIAFSHPLIFLCARFLAWAATLFRKDF